MVVARKTPVPDRQGCRQCFCDGCDVAGSTLSFREFLMLVALTSAKQNACTWLQADQVQA